MTDQYHCPSKIREIWKSSNVARFHTEPTLSDPVGRHEWGVSALVYLIWPDCSKNLLLAALFHDTGELRVGDLPAYVKWDDPELAQRHQKLEDDVLEALNLRFTLTPREVTILKVCDMLELCFWAHRHAMNGNDHAKSVFLTGVQVVLERLGDQGGHGAATVRGLLEDMRYELFG